MASAHLLTTHREIILSLHISDEEARYLKEMMQNPNTEDETPTLRKLREVIWDILNDVKVA